MRKHSPFLEMRSGSPPRAWQHYSRTFRQDSFRLGRVCVQRSIGPLLLVSLLCSPTYAEERLVQLATFAKILGHLVQVNQKSEFIDCHQKEIPMAVGDRVEETADTCPNGSIFRISAPAKPLGPLLNTAVVDTSGAVIGNIRALTIPSSAQPGVFAFDIAKPTGETVQATISLPELDQWTDRAPTALTLDATTDSLLT